METSSDSYKTLKGETEAVYKEKGSKFLCYAYHVRNEDEIKYILSELKKKYYDATHHCYAWRLGPEGESFRANDDGEPSGTAGRPILGQIQSRDLTDTLVVAVRYFGGTKLGVSGLVTAYKESAAQVLDEAEIQTLTVNAEFEVKFGFGVLNDFMKVVKDMKPDILSQEFDNVCTVRLSIRRGLEDEFAGRASKIEGIEIEHLGYN